MTLEPEDLPVFMHHLNSTSDREVISLKFIVNFIYKNTS